MVSLTVTIRSTCLNSFSIPWDAFFRVFKRFPFDSNNPIGYLLAIGFEYGTAAGAYYLISCTLALFLNSYTFLTFDFSCIMEMLCLYCYWFSAGWLHWLWCSLLVRLAKGLTMHSMESILRSIGWIGICFQSNLNACYQRLFYLHSSRSRWNALGVSPATEMFSKMLSLFYFITQ